MGYEDDYKKYVEVSFFFPIPFVSFVPNQWLIMKFDFSAVNRSCEFKMQSTPFVITSMTPSKHFVESITGI